MSTTEPPQKKSTRESILDAAVQLFAEQSSEVRLEDVAQKAGVSRQSVYVHFGSRTGLLIAMVRHIDERGKVPEHVEELARAPSALAAIEIAVAAPGSYYPLAYPIARLFLAGRYTDEAMKAAWEDRMQARRVICSLLIERLKDDGALSPAWTVQDATDTLWVLSSWQVWEQLVIEQGWSNERYTQYLRNVVRKTFIKGSR